VKPNVDFVGGKCRLNLFGSLFFYVLQIIKPLGPQEFFRYVLRGHTDARPLV